MLDRWKIIVVMAAVAAAYMQPAVAAANGEHVTVGSVHFDPVIGGGVAIFVGLITLMFVGQWIRFNAARRRAAGSASQESPRNREEVTNGSGQEDDGS